MVEVIGLSRSGRRFLALTGRVEVENVVAFEGW